PTTGATLAGTATFSATASDDVGVSRVEFWCDGTVLLGTDTTAPYNISYDTVGVPNGARTFTCKAYDTTGKSTTSADVTANVNNSATGGETWGKRFGNTAADFGAAVAVDAGGNIFVAGTFQGAVDFGGGVLVSAGTDSFLAKYSAAGVHQWSKKIGGTGDEVVKCIALDGSGNVFLAGGFYRRGNFGGADMASAGDQDGFIAKYSPQGGHHWSHRFGGGYTEQVNSIATDSVGNVVATGFFQTSLANPNTDFGGGHTLASWGFGVDTFLAKYSPDGANLWAKNFYNAGTDR